MRRTWLALLCFVSACSGSTSTPIASTARAGYALPGPWTLQAVASDSCSGLSADTKNRSYVVTIYQTGYDTISMNVAISGLTSTIMNASYSGLVINDHLRLVDKSVPGNLVIDGTFNGKVSVSKIAGTLSGNVTTASADCVASDHSLTFTR
jgi:hypothetical protein